jgi:sulfite reductase alpha subunit-like flavoprotein
MPKDVKKAMIHDVLMKEGELSEDAATKFIQRMVTQKEYIVDAW